MQVDWMSISLWHTPELTMSTIYSEFDLNINQVMDSKHFAYVILQLQFSAASQAAPIAKFKMFI